MLAKTILALGALASFAERAVALPSDYHLSVVRDEIDVQPPVELDANVQVNVEEERSTSDGNVTGSVEWMPFSKRGLVFNDAGMANALGGACRKCGWGWNWDQTPNGLDSRYSFVPMLWGDRSYHTGRWSGNAEKAIRNGAKAMLSFNEPDNAGQSNMSPQAAAEAHIKYMNPYAGRVKIGAPSITNSGAANQGVNWLNAFFRACNGRCKVDFCPVHWYSDARWADSLITHINNAARACGGRPVWLTEFAPTGGDVNGFLRNMLPKLDSHPSLDAYSYFMVGQGKLMSGSRSLNSAGQLYATL
ncbi:glycoside hydrolase [Purpureocillium lavendulum]|uniref:Glycoside hydrolase n=1 Tax=Purpureocillium lavendulum TaxID=1247861 RepID=A0AB34FKU7_9HYPO|nr:glycoside hydrolase [Purpureocillium lavendulum]